MASFDAPDSAAATAVDRDAQGAGALLGLEDYIGDDDFSKLLSASWPTPAIVGEMYGRYLSTPLGGVLVEQRFEAVDSLRMVSIWTKNPGDVRSPIRRPRGDCDGLPLSPHSGGLPGFPSA